MRKWTLYIGLLLLPCVLLLHVMAAPPLFYNSIPRPASRPYFGPVVPTGPFQPTRVAGLKLWLDGSALPTGSVPYWTDKVNGYNMTNQTAPNVSTTLNGSNVVTFNGSTMSMTNSFPNSPTYTLFLVMRLNAVAGATRVPTDGIDSTHRGSIGCSSASVMTYYGGNNTNIWTVNTSWHKYMFIINGSSSGNRVDYQPETAWTVNQNQGLRGMTLGCSYLLGNFANMDIAEVLLYDGVGLTASNKVDVMQYFFDKWGI